MLGGRGTFASDTAICGLQHNCREQRLTPETRYVLINAVTGEVELYDMGYRYSTSSDGGTRGGLETVGPVCAAG